MLPPATTKWLVYPFHFVWSSSLPPSLLPDHQLVFADATQPQIYVTTDEGASFNTQRFTTTTINPQTLVFHPTRTNYFLAYDNTNKRVRLHVFVVWGL